MYVIDHHFPNPSVEFSEAFDGANAYIDIYDFNLTLGNTSAETLMGYALWEGCTQPCNMPLFSLSNSGTPDLEMVAFGGITVNGTYYDDQLIFIQRQGYGDKVRECRFGTTDADVNGLRNGWHHVAVARNASDVYLYKDGRQAGLSVYLDDFSQAFVDNGTYACPLHDISTNQAELGNYRHSTGAQLKSLTTIYGLAHPMSMKMYDWRYYDTMLNQQEIEDQLTYTPTPTATPSATDSPSRSATPTRTLTYTPSTTDTRSRTVTYSHTPSASSSGTNTPSVTRTVIPTATASPSPSRTGTRSATATATSSATLTLTGTQSFTPTSSPTSSSSPTPSSTDTRSRTDTRTRTNTLSRTTSDTRSETSTYTVIPTYTPTYTPTQSHTPTATPSPSASSSPTPSATSSPTASPSGTQTQTPTPTPSPSPTLTPTGTPSGTLTSSPTPTATRTGGCIPHTWSCYLCDNGVPCDDGDAHTVDDKCVNMKCLGQLIDDMLDSPAASRQFEVTLRVKSDTETLLSPLVWVVYEDYGFGQVPWQTNTTASPGLTALAEGGATATLLEELKVMKYQQKIKGYGVAQSTDQITSPTTMGQEFSFKVTATQRDKLMFASMFVRTNDRFLAPLQPGIPFFIGMRPNYGESKDVAMWDAGTETNQPYFANLQIGQQSSQPGGGVAGGLREYGRIQQVHPWEFGIGNDTYPDPAKLVQLTLNPAMDVSLSDQTRAQRGIDALVEFTLEARQNIGNEIHVEFPEGFSFNEGGITSANITWWGLQRYISDAGNGQKDVWDDPQFDQPIFTVVDEQTRTVQIRWAEGTQLHPQYTTSFLITVHNVRSPNNCDLKTFRLKTFQCYTHDLHKAGTVLLRKCGSPIVSYESRGSHAAVPAQCSICNSCVFKYKNPVTLMTVYECESNGMTFLRHMPTFFTGVSILEKYFAYGPLYDGPCYP